MKLTFSDLRIMFGTKTAILLFILAFVIGLALGFAILTCKVWVFKSLWFWL